MQLNAGLKLRFCRYDDVAITVNVIELARESVALNFDGDVGIDITLIAAVNVSGSVANSI